MLVLLALQTDASLLWRDRQARACVSMHGKSCVVHILSF